MINDDRAREPTWQRPTYLAGANRFVSGAEAGGGKMGEKERRSVSAVRLQLTSQDVALFLPLAIAKEEGDHR